MPALQRDSLTPRDAQRLGPLIGNRAVSQLVAGRTIQRAPIKSLWSRNLEEEQRQAYREIVGDATKTEDLSVEKHRELIEFFKTTTVTFAVSELERALRLRTGEETVVKEPDPEKEEDRLKRERRLLDDGLSKLGGAKTWEALAPKIAEWWQTLKKAEASDTFELAYKANRMTARQIDLGGRGGRFSVAKPDRASGRTITLSRGILGIEERVKAQNFYEPKAGASLEYGKGLHDLSASLLDKRRNISEQLKFYDNAVVLFMPVPEEDDLRIFAALSALKDADEQVLRMMASQLTRIKLAQGSDMGTSFVDVSEEGGPDNFKYGSTGTVIRMKGGMAKAATDTELKARATNALEYKKILDAGVTTVNEIVMAYRQHASKSFPMYARWDGTVFHILDSNLKPTGEHVTNDGRVVKEATPLDVEESLEPAQENLMNERFLWACQDYIVEHASDVDGLRDLLTILPRHKRSELKEAYEGGVYLGESSQLAPAVKKRVLDLIDDIERAILFGGHGPRDLEHGRYVM